MSDVMESLNNTIDQLLTVNETLRAERDKALDENAELLRKNEELLRGQYEWKEQAEGESIACDSYRNERDAARERIKELEAHVLELIKQPFSPNASDFIIQKAAHAIDSML